MSLHVEVKIDVILHATEDSKKIFETLFDNFGLIEEDFIVQDLTGHFDNPITFLSINLKKKNAEMFLVKFFHKMKKNDFDEIYENIEKRISDSSLSIKISKQKMIEKKIVLDNKDAIKINISCPVYVKKESKKIYQQMLQLVNNSKKINII